MLDLPVQNERLRIERTPIVDQENAALLGAVALADHARRELDLLGKHALLRVARESDEENGRGTGGRRLDRVDGRVDARGLCEEQFLGLRPHALVAGLCLVISRHPDARVDVQPVGHPQETDHDHDAADERP